ncbi:hypothetical protein [Streptomyces sp. BH105]|uniref:hypothetical protein n=1 Tax=Streptomyces sp. BH105 TaxID=3410408 RepID=UPI003CE81AF3
MSTIPPSLPPVTRQLRRYQLTPETLDAFIRWWQDDLVPVRRAYGFDIPSAYVVRETAELIWLVAYPGDEARFTEAERKYNAWPDRVASMSRQPVAPVSGTAAFVRDVVPPTAAVPACDTDADL